MRTVVLVLLLVPMVAAEETLLSDDEGDQEAAFLGIDTGGGTHEDADLIAADLIEHPEAFEVSIRFAALERGTASTGAAMGGARASLYFDYEGKGYRVSFYHFVDLDGAKSVFSYLEEHDAGRDEYTAVERLSVSVDAATATLTASVPRTEIHAADGAPVAQGGTMSGFWAENVQDSRLFSDNIPAPSVESTYDRMPDEGVADATIEIQHGLRQDGHARLSSESAFRTSNGEATTFLFTALAENIGDEKDLFQLAADDVPEGWTVTLPEERLRLEGGEDREVPVLVTVPFNHQHGAVRQFQLAMQSQTDPDTTGRLAMGVRYTATPHPAGHHDDLFIHTADGFRFPTDSTPVLVASDGYFNTKEKDDFDTGEPITPRYFGCLGDGRVFGFPIYLQPGLSMGLDFDVARTGTLDLSFEMPAGASGASVGGALYVEPPGETVSTRDHLQGTVDEYKVADLSPVDGLEVQPGDPVALSLDITPTANGDYVPYEAGASLLLLVVIQNDSLPSALLCAGGPWDEPVIRPGATMALPLEEYHDDVSEYFSSLAGVDLYATGPQEMLVNPGETVVFRAVLENAGGAADFTLSLTGNTEHARILGSTDVAVASGSTRELAVAITAPVDAFDGQLLDVALHAVRGDDENARTLLRFVAEVDEDADHEDLSQTAKDIAGQLTQDKKSPGLGWLAVLAGVWVARRR